MSPERTCPDCGATLPADAPRALCPRCLMEAALLADWKDETGHVEPARPGVLDTIAQSIGPVPHVLLRDTTPGETPGPIVRPDGNGAGASIRYRIDGEIARGGMGVVLKGRDPDLGREVALKVLRDDYREDANVVRRFVEEAQIGGQLQHPGVVPIYELGTFADLRPFFAMKLVKGHTLAQLLEQRPNPSADLPRHLSIYEAICQTVAYAHARGVIHRDLKPSNVMVGSFGEVQVMDWGLAKVLPRGGVADDKGAGMVQQETVIATARSGSDGPGLSHAGSVMGTPSYMAPEQARGEIDQVDERADVFALGSILCEILTGGPAFVGRKSAEILRTAALGDTADALARLGACGGDIDLIGLAKNCLGREREDRPRDASAVAERMTAYLAGVQERMRKAELTSVEERARRRLTTVVAVSLLAISTASGLGFTYWLQERQASAARSTLALREATLLRNQAVEHPEDPARWPAALKGLEHARAALAEGGDPEIRRELAALADQIEAGAEAAERDRTLLAKLVDILSANADNFDASIADAAYARAFRDAGIDAEALEPAAAGARIAARPEPVRRALAAALDHWTAVRMRRGTKAEGWPRIVAVARAADPDPDRDALRAALAVEDQARRREQLRPLAERADAGSWEPSSLLLLADMLDRAGDIEAGVRVLRRAKGAHSTDAWVHFKLGDLLQHTTPPRPDEAIEAYTAARALVPELGHELAHILERHRRYEEAEAVFRDLVARRPDSENHLGCLGRHLKSRGRADEARPFLERALAAGRQAIEHNPKNAMLHTNLGNALNSLDRDDESFAEYRKAIELDPGLAEPRANLGIFLLAKGQVDEAISLLSKAIELAPRIREGHQQLGIALRAKGRVDEAIAVLRRAIELEPKDVECHNELGTTLSDLKGDYDGAIACFRRIIELDPRLPEGHCNLGVALRHKGRIDEAIAEYRTAIQLNGDHAGFHGSLAEALADQGKPDEAIAEYRAAIRLGSNDPHAHHKLGDVLIRQGKLDEAIAAYRQAIRVLPDDVGVRKSLGAALCDMKRDYPAAEAEFRKAIRLKSNDPEAHYNLGIALGKQGKLDEASAALQETIRLKPDDAEAHHNLGAVLAQQGKWDEAIAAWREAIRLRPHLAEVHAKLGAVLSRQGKMAEAIAAYREAIRLKPDLAQAHISLGAILCDVKHDYTGAEAEFRTAIRLRPDEVEAHTDLGNALRGQGKWSEAIAAYREATRLKPDVAEAHCNLGGALRQQGQYAEALAEFRVGHELGSKRADWRYPSAAWVADAERMTALATRLPALLKGDDRPRDVAERLALAQMCYDTKRHAAAARFWAEALAAEPKLGDDRQAGHRYNAACAAALAGCGQGTGDPKPNDAARARLRGQALDWLKAERAAWAKVLDSGDAQARSTVAQNLQHWQADPDLVGVRDADAIEKLPEDERKKWQALWKDVDSLLKGVATTSAALGKQP